MNYSTNKRSDPDCKLMTILKPIIRVNQLFGVCPHEISGDMMIFRWKSFKVLHTLFTFIILLAYFIFLVYQFTQSFSSEQKREMPELVSLGLWIGGTLTPLCLLIVTFNKRNKFTLFFEKMWEYKGPLKGLMQCKKPLKYSRYLYAFYIILCITSCSRISFLLIRNPLHDISILNLFYSPSETPSTRMIAAACVFQCYMVIVKYSASTFIEVLSSSLARSFVSTTITIIYDLKKSHDGTPRSQLPYNINSKASGVLRDNGVHPQKDMQYHPHIKRVSDNNLDLLNRGRDHLYPVIPEVCPSNPSDLNFSLKPYPSDNYSPAYSSSASTPTDGTGPIILALKRFNCIANMQRLINCIFGLILALDTALLVFMCCLLMFLQINHLGSSNVSQIDGIIHSFSATCFIIRLVIVFINLGNVHETSTCFNGQLISCLMQAKRPKPADVNLILAHLSAHSVNPVCYSAGGFFTFSRSSLLTVISVIITYVVFLLQAKN